MNLLVKVTPHSCLWYTEWIGRGYSSFIEALDGEVQFDTSTFFIYDMRSYRKFRKIMDHFGASPGLVFKSDRRRELRSL